MNWFLVIVSQCTSQEVDNPIGRKYLTAYNFAFFAIFYDIAVAIFFTACPYFPKLIKNSQMQIQMQIFEICETFSV